MAAAQTAPGTTYIGTNEELRSPVSGLPQPSSNGKQSAAATLA